LSKTITNFNKFKRDGINFKYDIVILNKYSDKDTNHIGTLVQLKKIFSKEKALNVLPFEPNLTNISPNSLNYSIKEF
jgi:hypothetical protein